MAKLKRWWKRVKQMANLVPTTGFDDLNRYSPSFLNSIENIQRLDIANLIISAVLMDPLNSFNLYFIQTSPPPPFDFVLLFKSSILKISDLEICDFSKWKFVNDTTVVKAVSRGTNSLFHER